VPRTVGTISEEEGEVARRLYTESLTRMFTTFSGGVAAEVVESDE
jgi:hypothetical protein